MNKTKTRKKIIRRCSKCGKSIEFPKKAWGVIHKGSIDNSFAICDDCNEETNAYSSLIDKKLRELKIELSDIWVEKNIINKQKGGLNDE